MARIRTVKPDFFKHDGLFEAEIEFKMPLRIAYIGLWCCADKAGRFKWRPRQLKLDCLPYDDCDFSRVLDALATRGFLVKYRVDGEEYGCIPSFEKHQIINNREKASELPAPEQGDVVDPGVSGASVTRESRVGHASVTPLCNVTGEGKGKEGEGEGKGVCTEPASLALVQQGEPPVITLPLNSGAEHPVIKSQVDEWLELFPAVDVMQQLRTMRAWLQSNPQKRKTKAGIGRFITNWLAREQDRGGGSQPGTLRTHSRQAAIEANNRAAAEDFVNDIQGGFR